MSQSESTSMRLDRTALSLVALDDDEERRYWHSRTAAERLRHAETLRRINYGSRAAGRLERILTVVPLEG